MNQISSSNNDSAAQAKQQEFLERAKKGILEHLNNNGKRLDLVDLHDFSFKKFFIQHQGFSRLIESLVDQKLVDYDYATNSVVINQSGIQYIS